MVSNSAAPESVLKLKDETMAIFAEVRNKIDSSFPAEYERRLAEIKELYYDKICENRGGINACCGADGGFDWLRRQSRFAFSVVELGGTKYFFERRHGRKFLRREFGCVVL